MGEEFRAVCQGPILIYTEYIEKHFTQWEEKQVYLWLLLNKNNSNRKEIEYGSLKLEA